MRSSANVLIRQLSFHLLLGCSLSRLPAAHSLLHHSVQAVTLAAKAMLALLQDWLDIDFAIQMDVDFIAVSFVKTADVINNLKSYLTSRSSKVIEIVAKIESHDSVPNAQDIIEASDAVMIARGDLGMVSSFSAWCWATQCSRPIYLFINLQHCYCCCCCCCRCLLLLMSFVHFMQRSRRAYVLQAAMLLSPCLGASVSSNLQHLYQALHTASACETPFNHLV